MFQELKVGSLCCILSWQVSKKILGLAIVVKVHNKEQFEVLPLFQNNEHGLSSDGKRFLHIDWLVKI